MSVSFRTTIHAATLTLLALLSGVHHSPLASAQDNGPRQGLRVGSDRDIVSSGSRLEGPRSGTMLPTSDQVDVARDRLFEDLAEEFEHFDRLGNLVRRVSHLVKPSVIHIEAHKTQGSGATAESFDEAGSGVVLDVAGESWVLTNRHVIKGAASNQIVMRTSDGRRWVPEKILMDPNTDVAVMKLSPSIAGIESAERDS
ncbi:trypsin-like peptidase domain-containing protein, partial [Rhodopirellula sp. UBA1907]